MEPIQWSSEPTVLYIFWTHLFSDLSSEFPPIEYEHERDEYKRAFDDDHQEYKELQAEMDAINKKMAEVDRELDDLQEGSPQFLVSCVKDVFVLLYVVVFYVKLTVQSNRNGLTWET